MTNEELKKKIVEILEETEYEWTEEKNGYILQIFYDKLADSLIAAGYGDVKEAEHRTEVAEKALLMACANAVKDEKDNVNIELLVRVVYDKYLKQAKEELAEEGKNDILY